MAVSAPSPPAEAAIATISYGGWFSMNLDDVTFFVHDPFEKPTHYPAHRRQM
jgi:hypothetical protein